MTLQTRVQGPSLTVDDSLRGVLALGLLEVSGVELERVPPDFERERDELVARLATQYAGRAPADIPGVAETRALFHQLDIDPTKTRPSSEALLRRVLQGKGLPRVNLAVDVCNLCSLVVLFCPTERADRNLSAALEHLSNRLTRHCSASVTAVQVIQ